MKEKSPGEVKKPDEWTAAEDAILVAMKAENKTWKEIGDAFKGKDHLKDHYKELVKGKEDTEPKGKEEVEKATKKEEENKAKDEKAKELQEKMAKEKEAKEKEAKEAKEAEAKVKETKEAEAKEIKGKHEGKAKRKHPLILLGEDAELSYKEVCIRHHFVPLY